MKAIRVYETGAPDVMKLEELPDLNPGPGEVVVKIEAVGVNPVDTYFRAGGTYKPTLPYTPGMDGAGTVSAVGTGVSSVRDGERVYTAGSISGTYAQYSLCRQDQVRKLPENVSFEQGAGVYVPYATAYRALFLIAKAQPGETVLIHGGSGGVGLAATQFAKAAGLKVIATASTHAGLQLIRDQGAHHAVNHSTDEYLKEIMGITKDQGVQVILEMTANVNLAKDLQVIAKQGRIVIIGSRGTIEIDPRGIMGKEAQILGQLLLTIDAPTADVLHAAIYAGLQNGTLNPVVGKKFTLADAPAAHIAVMERGAYGKIVLTP